MSESSKELVKVNNTTGMVHVGEQILKPDKVIEAAIASGYYKQLKSPADGYIIAAYGASLGMSLVSSLSNIVLINGRMTFSAGFIASLVKKGGKYRYKVVTKTDKECQIEFFEKIEYCSKEGVRYWEWESQGVEKFTLEMAKRAGLLAKTGGNWSNYPEAMMFARTITAGVRTYCPDLLAGQSAYTPDELDPSIPMKMNSEGDLVPDAEYVTKTPVPVQVKPSSQPDPKWSDSLNEIKTLMDDTKTDAKTFLKQLLNKDDLALLTGSEQDKVRGILKQKKQAQPF